MKNPSCLELRLISWPLIAGRTLCLVVYTNLGGKIYIHWTLNQRLKSLLSLHSLLDSLIFVGQVEKRSLLDRLEAQTYSDAKLPDL